jgi:hypothetical protein
VEDVGPPRQQLSLRTAPPNKHLINALKRDTVDLPMQQNNYNEHRIDKSCTLTKHC